MLHGLIDSVNVSLNTSDPRQWLELMRPNPQYRENGFGKVLEFVKNAVTEISDVCVSTVDGNGVDTEKFRALAAELGARARIRELLTPGEDIA